MKNSFKFHENLHTSVVAKRCVFHICSVRTVKKVSINNKTTYDAKRYFKCKRNQSSQ